MEYKKSLRRIKAKRNNKKYTTFEKLRKEAEKRELEYAKKKNYRYVQVRLFQ